MSQRSLGIFQKLVEDNRLAGSECLGKIVHGALSDALKTHTPLGIHGSPTQARAWMRLIKKLRQIFPSNVRERVSRYEEDQVKKNILDAWSRAAADSILHQDLCCAAWFYAHTIGDEELGMQAKAIDQQFLGQSFEMLFSRPPSLDPAVMERILRDQETRQSTDRERTVAGPHVAESAANKALPLKDATASINPNHYSHHVIDVLGRDEEVKILRDFLYADAKFLWMQLAGEGGQGKSRLAWDLVQDARKEAWHAGFLRADDMGALAERWPTWTPDRSTLVVFDYVLGVEKSIGDVLEALAKAGRGLNHKVRFLLVERQAWREGGLTTNASHDVHFDDDGDQLRLLPAVGSAAWFRKLKPERGDLDLREPHLVHNNGLLKLSALSDASLVKVVRTVARSDGMVLSHGDHAILHALKMADRHGRPLYAYFLARAMSVGTPVLDWGHDELLTWALDNELNARWCAEFEIPRDRRTGKPVFAAAQEGDAKPLLPDYGDGSASMLVALLATMVEVVDLDALRESIISSRLNGLTFGALKRQAQVIAANPIDGTTGGTRHVRGLEPDVLGEWFVLTALRSGEEFKLLHETAWRTSPKEMARFLRRLAQDYPTDHETYRLLQEAPPTEDAMAAFGHECVDILQALRRNRIDPPAVILEALRAADKRGDPRAHAGFGLLYYYGIIVDQDLKKAASRFKKCAELNDIAAVSGLALCKSNGHGLEKNPTEAFELWRAAASRGDPVAVFNVGICYFNGLGVQVDEVRAEAQFRQAAEAGSTAAFKALVSLYEAGQCVEPDAAIVTAWYSEVAKTHDASAMFRYATRLEQGLGIDGPNPYAAMLWYRRAAKAKNVRAMLSYAKNLEHGVGVAKPDTYTAMQLYLEAATLGSLSAKVRFGRNVARGQSGAATPDAVEYWVGMAVELLGVDGMLSIGRHLAGVTQGSSDPEAANWWFRRAAYLGNSAAMAELGINLARGAGEAQDIEAALGWLIKAAKLREPRAMANLAFHLEHGLGIVRDISSASMWYRRAADLGECGAMVHLGLNIASRTCVNAGAASAIAWFGKAEALGDAAASFNVRALA